MNRLSSKTARMLIASMVAILLAACGDDEPKTSKQKLPQQSTVTVTLDAERQDIYDTSCKVCHGMANTGAPVSGQPADWQDRSAKGIDVVLDNTMNGFQAMPPMGGCFDCTEEDFRQLITFMSGGMLK